MKLVPIDPARDAEALHAILGDEASCRYLPRPAQPSVAATQALLERWHEGQRHDWAVQLDGATVGRVSLFTQREGVWEAACMVVPSARGQGLSARALAIAIDGVFDQEDAHRIEADIDPDNHASIRVFERLGFTREGHLRHTWRTHIGLRDSLVFGLLRDQPRPWRV